MNKQQNYSLKKDKEKIKQLEIENALLKQKIALIYSIVDYHKEALENSKEKEQKSTEIFKENGNN